MEHQNWALPEVFQPTFAVKLNGGALGRAVVPRTDVDGTTLQYPWLASVSLGCSHQHTDPVKGKREGIRKGPISRSVSGGRMHLDLWAKNGGGVDVPWVADARGRGWSQASPCAAVTNSAPPSSHILPPSSTTRRNQNQFLEKKGGIEGLDSSFPISSVYLPRLAQTCELKLRPRG